MALSLAQDVAPQIEALGDMFDVPKDFRLRRIALASGPFLLELLVEGKRVVEAFDVAARAGVAIPVPGTADVVAGFEHWGRQARLAGAVQLVEAGNGFDVVSMAELV
jgi:hypothetical protein